MTKTAAPLAERPRPLAARTAFSWFALVIFALLLSWPIVSIPGHRGSGTMFYYVFVVWSALIVLLGVIAFASRPEPPASAERGNGDAAPREDG